MKNVVASVVQAEFGTIFLNGQKAVPIRKKLEEMKWPQPSPPIEVKNSTATGIPADKSSKKCQRYLT